jgi:leucyl aminopeptidase
MSVKLTILDKKPASKNYDSFITCLSLTAAKKIESAKTVPAELKKLLKMKLARKAASLKEATLIELYAADRQYIVYILPKSSEQTFFKLEHARKLYAITKRHQARTVCVDIADHDTKTKTELSDAIYAAFIAGNHMMPTFKQKKQKTAQKVTLSLSVGKEGSKEIMVAMKKTEARTSAGNLIRDLLVMPSNILNPENFHKISKDHAKKYGFKFKFHGYEALKKKGAGAFCAVAQADSKAGAGIAELEYTPSNKSSKDLKHIVLVGKGITFDVGGVNVKPGISMLGMKGDMGGAATAFSFLEIAHKEKWNVKLTVYLAISENKISNTAYQPDDVVTSLSGKTIEVIHTDAEGRMALADTLHMASSTSPDLIVDFATLTGASVRAIGTSFSSVYTNNDDYQTKLIEAGRESGERVWPFPLDKDYARSLESNVADIKQCRPSGGCDHIEAAIFLKEFVGTTNWIHFDLSCAKSEGPLAHVSTKESGFGPRVVCNLLEKLSYI